MKLTLQIKVLPTSEQSSALLTTIERFNQACNFASEAAFRLKTASQVRIHKETYYEIRRRFGLTAQMAVRAIGRVTEAYRRDRAKCHVFRPYGAMVLDDRILSYKGVDRVSIATLEGRKVMPFVCGPYQEQRLRRIRGQADLIYRDKMFFLLQTIDLPEPPLDDQGDFLGVDLGIKNIATDSDGEIFSGGLVNGLRKRHARLRARLQSKGTKSAKRLLKNRRRKEQRFARDVNHCSSKKLGVKAKAQGKGIALEDLKGIRSRITVRKPQRRIQHSWAFAQLRAFVEYKAKLAGVPVVMVNPRNTSRTCPACGHIALANRPSQAFFSCVACGFSGHADHIAAVNIRRVAVSLPYVAVA